MVTILQYPDVLTYKKVISGGSHYDGDGNLVIDPQATETVSLRCRAEANDKGQYIISEDGAKVEYGWVIYFPLPAPAIAFGTDIQITRNGNLRASGELQRLVVNQLNAKGWL